MLYTLFKGMHGTRGTVHGYANTHTHTHTRVSGSFVVFLFVKFLFFWQNNLKSLKIIS